MVSKSVIVTCSLCILLNVIFPSGDVYSDVALMIDTITFNVASNLEVSGCRVCHGRNEAEVYKILNQSCQQCFNGYFCGTVPQMLNKKYDLQKENTCETSSWFVDFEDKTGAVEMGKCGIQKCCLENKKDYNKGVEMIDIDRKVLIFPDTFKGKCKKMYKKVFAIYLLTGNNSWASCKRKFLLPITQRELCNKAEMNKLELEERVFRMENLINKNITLSEGFEFSDGCGIHMRPLIKDLLPSLICDNDACLLHLRYLQFFTSTIHDYETWKTTNDYLSGYGKIGGKLCHLLKYYGWSILIPILLNMAFSFKIFFDDYQKNEASFLELIVVLFLFYPQWKTLKFLYSYWMDHRDEKKLEKDKDDFDRDVSSLEPFLESAIQVLQQTYQFKRHQFRYIYFVISRIAQCISILLYL